MKDFPEIILPDRHLRQPERGSPAGAVLENRNEEVKEESGRFVSAQRGLRAGLEADGGGSPKGNGSVVVGVDAEGEVWIVVLGASDDGESQGSRAGFR